VDQLCRVGPSHMYVRRMYDAVSLIAACQHAVIPHQLVDRLVMVTCREILQASIWFITILANPAKESRAVRALIFTMCMKRVHDS